MIWRLELPEPRIVRLKMRQLRTNKVTSGEGLTVSDEDFKNVTRAEADEMVRYMDK